MMFILPLFMKPYIIKKTDQFLSDLILPSVFYVFFTPLLFLCNEMSLLICLSLPYFGYFAYILYKRIKNKQDYEVLVVDKHGIKCEDEIEVFNATWDDVSEILMYKKGPNRSAWTEMTIICNGKKKYTFSFKPYTYAMNLYRLRNRIIYFSKRKHIITSEFHLWMQW